MATWQEVSDEVCSRILAIDTGTAVAFAAVTAERLVRLDPRRQPFTQSLRPLLDMIWRAAAGDRTAFKPIATMVGEFYIGPLCHNDGQDGPDDADGDPAAAILYAANCYLHRQPLFAALVARRAVDAAGFRVEVASDVYSGDDDIDFEAEADAAMMAEARQQLADLDGVVVQAHQLAYARHGLPIDEIERLLAALRGLITVPEHQLG